MFGGRKKITIDMIRAASEREWTVGQTSRHYGLHRKSVDAACERFGIMLPLHGATVYVPGAMIRHPAADSVAGDTGRDTKATWSASPAAVERALKRLGKVK